jgi:hypothetical protein
MQINRFVLIQSLSKICEPIDIYHSTPQGTRLGVSKVSGAEKAARFERSFSERLLAGLPSIPRAKSRSHNLT